MMYRRYGVGKAQCFPSERLSTPSITDENVMLREAAVARNLTRGV